MSSLLIFSTLFASVLTMSISMQVRADDTPPAAPATPSTPATEPAPSATPTPSGKMGKHSSENGLSLKGLKAQLTLTPDQVTQLKPLFDAKKADLKGWDDANSQNLSDLKAKLDTAKDSGTKADVKAAGAAIKTLMDGRTKIVTKDDAAIKAVLTPDQLKTWTSYELFQHESSMLTKATLTDAQKTQIHALSDQFAPAAIAAPDVKTLEQVHKDLHKSVVSTVLTEEVSRRP